MMASVIPFLEYEGKHVCTGMRAHAHFFGIPFSSTVEWVPWGQAMFYFFCTSQGPHRKVNSKGERLMAKSISSGLSRLWFKDGLCFYKHGEISPIVNSETQHSKNSRNLYYGYQFYIFKIVYIVTICIPYLHHLRLLLLLTWFLMKLGIKTI